MERLAALKTSGEQTPPPSRFAGETGVPTALYPFTLFPVLLLDTPSSAA
jgi:hypothetical protein